MRVDIALQEDRTGCSLLLSAAVPGKNIRGKCAAGQTGASELAAGSACWELPG